MVKGRYIVCMVTVGSQLEGELTVNLFIVVTIKCFKVLAHVGGSKNLLALPLLRCLVALDSVRGTPGCQSGGCLREGHNLRKFQWSIVNTTVSDHCLTSLIL